MKMLIADDETPKLANIEQLVAREFSSIEIIKARSVRSTIAAILTSQPNILLLDMSLPTFDIAPGEDGGRPQGFGGIEVLRHVEFKGVAIPTIVITQYEAFPDNGKHVDLRELSKRLERDHPRSFVACVYYNSMIDDWHTELAEHIRSIAGVAT